MSVLSPNGSETLTLLSIYSDFFDVLWYIDPVFQRFGEHSIHHTCSNQYMCQALRGMDSAVNSHLLNRNTANCEIRIPLHFDQLLSALRNPPTLVYMFVLWSDQQKVHVITMEDGGSSLEHCMMMEHQLHMLAIKRFFLQRTDIAFETKYVLPLAVLRSAVNALHNVGHDHFSLIDNAAEHRLVVVGWKSQCVSIIPLEYSLDASSGDGDKTDQLVGMNYPLEPVNLFLRHKCTALKRVCVMFNANSVCFETVFETAKSNVESKSGQTNTGVKRKRVGAVDGVAAVPGRVSTLGSARIVLLMHASTGAEACISDIVSSVRLNSNTVNPKSGLFHESWMWKSYSEEQTMFLDASEDDGNVWE